MEVRENLSRVTGTYAPTVWTIPYGSVKGEGQICKPEKGILGVYLKIILLPNYCQF